MVWRRLCIPRRFLLLRSLKAIRKESTVVTRILGRPTPDPRLGSSVELLGGDAGGLLNLHRIGKALPGQRIAAKEPPPTFLQVQPAGSFGNEDVMEPRMLCHPGTGLGTVVAAEIIGDDEDLSFWIVGFDLLKQRDIIR